MLLTWLSWHTAGGSAGNPSTEVFLSDSLSLALVGFEARRDTNKHTEMHAHALDKFTHAAK